MCVQIKKTIAHPFGFSFAAILHVALASIVCSAGLLITKIHRIECHDFILRICKALERYEFSSRLRSVCRSYHLRH